MLRNLTQLRESRGFSMRELARRSGTSHVNVHFIESSRHSPRPGTARALADALGVSVEDLYDGNSRQSETTTVYLIS